MEKIKASIIIRAYNAEKTIARAIESALAQNFPADAYEIIIIDDGSSDGTPVAIQYFTSDSRVRTLMQGNRGAIAAANAGFHAARGTYVTLLDSDDEFMPDLLAEVIPVLDADQSLAFAYVDYFEEFGGKQKAVFTRDVFQMIAGGTLYRREPFFMEGFFKQGFLFDDYELVLRTWDRWRFAHVAKPLYIYHRRSISLTGDSARVERGLRELLSLYPERRAEIERIRSYALSA